MGKFKALNSVETEVMEDSNIAALEAGPVKPEKWKKGEKSSTSRFLAASATHAKRLRSEAESVSAATDVSAPSLEAYLDKVVLSSGFFLFQLRTPNGTIIRNKNGELGFLTRKDAKEIRDTLANKFRYESFVTKGMHHDQFHAKKG